MINQKNNFSIQLVLSTRMINLSRESDKKTSYEKQSLRIFQDTKLSVNYDTLFLIMGGASEGFPNEASLGSSFPKLMERRP